MTETVAQRAFQRGYRQALRDALQELDEGGTDQLREWLVEHWS